MSETKNICDLIKCPFANINPGEGRSSGCTRYSVSNHCHLMSHDQKFRGFLQPNQYWLFSSENLNLEELKHYNDDFIANDESSQRRLEFDS